MSLRDGTTLIIDDDEDVRRTCVEMLRARGHQTLAAASVGEGLRLFGERHPAAVLLDLKLPDGAGIDVMRELQRQSPGTPVVVIPGFGSVTEAVEAMRMGATDYIEKPISRDRLFRLMDRILQRPLPGGETDPETVADGSRYGMVGRSEPMRRIYQLVEMAAPTKCRVFISGESGTGKELIAHAIHARSPRREHPFIELNCAAIPGELIESELFGHVKGSFTGAFADRAGKFELADSGTLFLDEVGDMSLAAQAKVLRALEDGVISRVGSEQALPVDVRVIAATNKTLATEIAAGRFREDLLYRLNVVPIDVPPLRTRRGDIPQLVEHFVRQLTRHTGLEAKPFDKD